MFHLAPQFREEDWTGAVRDTGSWKTKSNLSVFTYCLLVICFPVIDRSRYHQGMAMDSPYHANEDSPLHILHKGNLDACKGPHWIQISQK